MKIADFLKSSSSPPLPPTKVPGCVAPNPGRNPATHQDPPVCRIVNSFTDKPSPLHPLGETKAMYVSVEAVRGRDADRLAKTFTVVTKPTRAATWPTLKAASSWLRSLTPRMLETLDSLGWAVDDGLYERPVGVVARMSGRH